ncbi:hypothetical protein PAXINDRAFT_19210 [Paxillus involutus ATCC 200175]|uniref:Uncharacterized protein n=1 Tax=Paxillus involutus ATCC 200175 TaxID=664439 RepID=A0A0C9TI59_PAXIN|nr:hypothetical protein PAXINDRAFT_19210 [Paxillus involutus ATCC 200175]
MRTVVDRHNSLSSSSSLPCFPDHVSSNSSPEVGLLSPIGPPYTQRPPQARPSGYYQSAYTHDPQSLEEHCRNLELQMASLTAERNTLRAVCYESHHQLGPVDVPIDPLLAAAPKVDMKQPTAETHPNIKFWNRADWAKWSERAENQLKSTRGIIPYLEGEHGEAISAMKVKAIRGSMRDAWNELASRGLSPVSWGRASTTARKLFRALMEGDWPIFKLCNDAWKLEYLACTAYPGWKRAHLDNDGKLKKKVNDKEDNDSDCSHDDDGNESHHEDKGNTGPGHSSTKSKKTKKRKLSKVKSEIPAKKAKVDEAQGKTATENKNGVYKLWCFVRTTDYTLHHDWW